ncbi:chitobiase/beta-hexosaminidase C-terminal domain-containing protein [Lysinibacillus irui]|uniref:Chitobiase/beta-hexosaminidase C-terminal domain-containing protein n=1 Tax=Lysinibacillus irui TaxID=2998077 RepID=A0ABU5NRZ4_9BACI|nr:chitobiase/beta-hexosaminidase C-terminal domain-containing protein [Lysinibacillus irui]MEA0553427.1 chitobiase/beta-hexosaminidase C-terminal domain-containing protein [Lysinibacillus irui]MEA0978813.1 chitobiase/beta-hexosaminidase C-terminal domain-containing protein [Lysinibacillus irui]MEA1044967.1 chitobiase/beta-hexosaminidase C-terminal domain-containing protein [Lysinibacillus irui]
MKRYKINFVSKIALSFLLVISMILPYFTVVKADTTEAIGVGEAVNQFDPTTVKSNVTVEGYIVGFAKSETSYSVIADSDTNIAIADTPGETDVTKMLYIQLPSSYRANFGLYTNPSNLGKKVKITGSLEKYFGNHAGLKSPTSIDFVGDDTTEPNPPETATIAEARAAVGTDRTVQIQGTVTTTPGSWGGKAFYVQDETAGVYVFSSSAEAGSLAVGDIVKITGKTSLYSGEVQFNSPTIERLSTGKAPAPQTMTLPIDDSLQGELITIENVKIKDLAPSGTYGTFEFKAVDAANNELLIRHDNRTGYQFSQFEADGFNNNDVITVTGIASIFNGTYQLKTLSAESFQLVSNYEPTQVGSVKALPATGEVYAGTKVTLSTDTPNAIIYYTIDGTEPTTASEIYDAAAGIVVNKAMTIKAFATATGLDDSEVASFNFTVKEEPTVISITEARNKEIGQTVIVSGIVTAKLETATAHIQDEDGAAIAIYPADSLTANVGDRVTVQGQVAEYSGLKQLVNISLVGVPVPSTIPEPHIIKSNEVAEDNESKLVTIKNVAITGSGQNFTGTDQVGTFAIYDKTRDSGLVSGKTYGEITGIVGQYTNHQLLPLRIIEDVTKVQDIKASHVGGVTAGTKVSLSTMTEGATIYYTVDGSTPTNASTKYTEEILVNKPMTIKAIAVKEGLTNSAIATFVYEIIDTKNAKISDIQGASHTSPYVDLTVNDVEGIVTFVINSSSFIMQEVDSAFDGVKSTAIKVNKSAHNVAVGDIIKVSGKVMEEGGNSRLKDTQISAANITKTGTAVIPKALVIGEDLFPPNKIIDNDAFSIFDPQEDGIDFWESIEYMRVSFPEARVIGPIYNNDSPIVVPSTTNNTFNVNGGLNIAADDYNPEKIMLEGVAGKNYDSGDRFNEALIGFVENFTDGYRLNTNKVFPEVTKANIQQEVTHLEPVADKLNVASYNIENFSNNPANTSNEKVARIASTFVKNMKSPDIITLVEVQDNDGQIDSGNADASESYMRLINAIKAAGGPAYDWIDVMPINNTVGGAPGGNIRVGYLYNPTRVSLVTGTKGLGDQANTWTADGSLALNPGFVDPSKFVDTRKPIAAEFEFQEERVVIIGAHLNSKGGDGSLWGPTQPPVLESVTKRIQLAQAINDFIDEGLAINPELNIIVAGDMNDFEFTPALETLKGDVLTNMVDKAPEQDRFTYFFQGNNQVLDHILVSNNLADDAKIDLIHMNANFTEAQGRASDHDPVLVQIDLKAGNEEVPTPIIPENVYNFDNYKTGKLIMNRESISLTLGKNTNIKNGIAVFSEYAEFHGEGFADKTVTISPKKGNAIIDFKGTQIGKIIIEGKNVKEIRNLPTEANITYTKGASEEEIEFK